MNVHNRNMFMKVYLNILFVIVTLIGIIDSSDDYASNEEMTTSSLDFSAESSDEFFDPLQDNLKSYRTDDLLPEYMPDKDIMQKNNVLTTMVPDYINIFSSSRQQEDNGNTHNKLLKENEIKFFQTNGTTSSNSVSMNGFFSHQGKNFSEENRIMHNSEEEIEQETVTTTLTSPTLRTKHGKQIQIIKLLPHEALRNFIEDAYIRTPLAVLVDTASNSLEKTKSLWKDALRSNAALDVVLLAFNVSGVSVTYSFKNTRTLLAGINSIKESESSLIAGNAFFGIIRASELVPYDSAVFISTASVPADSNLAQYAAITLLKKRIRLYLIWFGEKSMNENETQEVTGGSLGEVAIRSGGEILHVNRNPLLMDDENVYTLISDNYRGSQEIEIPVETTMNNLHMKMDTATLETPNGGL